MMSLYKFPNMIALKEDDSMDIKFLKELGESCIRELEQFHLTNRFLGSIRPRQIFYHRRSDRMLIIEFRKENNELSDDSYSRLKWMAPEIYQKNSKSTEDSDVFTMGLVFFHLLTGGGNPMAITSTTVKNKTHYQVKVDFKLLDSFRTDTDTILFIDLIKRMVQEKPVHRETRSLVYCHGAFKTNTERLEVVQGLSKKCFNGNQGDKYLISIIDMHKLHMVGSLGESSTEWLEFLAEAAKHQLKPDIKVCSSLLEIFKKKSYKSIQEERSHIDLCLNFLQRIVIICPNFFPHLYNIQREEVLTKTEGAFEEIFKHLTNEKLGAGSHSTIVYKGDFGQRPIAIKKVSKATTNSVDQEISIMLKIDRHPNILRFFAKEEDENFIYIGMELCDYNLETFIKDQNLRKEMTNKTILQQTAEGLNHLHHLKILHRDIKPENILIYHENGIYSIKLADFGISKDLNAKMIFSTANAPGTPGWIAPEVRRAGHTNLSDVFSLGAVFYYVCVGNMLSNELGLDYIGVDDLLITKVQSLANGPGNNNQIMQMDLLRRMLKLKPELRPSVKKVLHHPLFWDDKRCLDIILQIRKKFDILDPNFIRKIRNDHQKVLDDTPLVQNLKDMLDVDKAVVHNDWIIMLDKVLADEFKKGYDKKSVSDLLRAMRNKWMHQEELTNSIKNLFGNFTESEYLNYFTSKFPRLLIYCYNTVEEHAIDLFEEYFWQQPVQQPVQAPASGKVIPGCGMEGFTLLIKCGDVTIIPETKVKTIFLKIYDISHLFVFENKSFTNFLQRCSSNITQLMFIHGSLKFDSLNKILQKLPNLKKIHFIDVKYETQRTNSSIEQKSCQKLEELEIVGELAQAFQECHTIKQLTVEYPPLTLQKLLEKYSKIEELTVTLNHYYHHYIYNSNKSSLAIHQLKVLKIYIDTIKEDKMRENFFAFINTQKKLKNFSVTTLINAQISQSFCKQLVACIFNMKSLTFLDINCREMVEEVRKFIESCPTKNTGLEEFSFPLESIKLELVFGHFVSLRKLKILCYNSTDLNSYSEMYKTLNKSKLESVKLLLFGESFQYLTLLRLGSLQVLHVTLRKDEFKAYQLTQDNVFDILQELLLKHPNITDLAIMFDYESRILNLIQMIMIVLTKLEKLVFLNHASKIKEEDIRKIVSLEKLKSWTINAYESEPFYKVFN